MGRGGAKKWGAGGGCTKLTAVVALLFLFTVPVLAATLDCAEQIGTPTAIPSNGWKYSWARTKEGIGMAIAGLYGNEAKMAKHLAYADKRLVEACAESELGNGNNVQSLMNDYNGEIEQVNDLSPKVSAKTNSVARNQLTQRTKVLTALLTKVPEEGQKGIQNALTAVSLTKKTLEENRVSRLYEAGSELSAAEVTILDKTITIDSLIPAKLLPESGTATICVFSNTEKFSEYLMDYSKDSRTIVLSAINTSTCDIKTDVEKALEMAKILQDGKISLLEAQGFKNSLESTEE